MSKIKLSDYVAKRLKKHGVKHFFMISGGGAMHLNDSLGHAIPFTACHHEQACAIAAEGYARVSGDLAVVNVTTGPGGLNCLNGLFGEWTDSVSVLYISGQVKTVSKMSSYPELQLRQLGDQEVDIISVVKPLTKYAISVTEPNMIKYYIDKAIFEATSGRKGPCWIDIPIDIQAALIDEDELKDFTPPQKTTLYQADSEKCVSLKGKPKYSISNGGRNKYLSKEILHKLLSTKRPLVVAGHGIRLSNQTENLKKILELTKIPFVTTLNGFDMIESDNPYYIGRIGTIGQRAGNFALQNADLILFLGTRNNIRQVSYNWENFGKNAFKIGVDIDAAELEKPYVKYDMKFCADLADFIPELVNKIEKSSYNNREKWVDWLNFCKKLKDKYSFKNRPEAVQKDKIEPYHFTYALSKNLKENDVVVLANATPTICTFQNSIIKTGQRYITNSGDASMGYGLPAAIGAYYAVCNSQKRPHHYPSPLKGEGIPALSKALLKENCNRKVICLEGDGSIMMNIQELQTVVYNKIPIKIFVINNNGYSSIRQSQKNFFSGRMTASGAESGVSVPDFVKVGNAFGLKTKRIVNPKNMEEEIKEVLASNVPILCEVITEEDYIFTPKLSSKKFEDGTIISPTLEDMYPFLGRKEFEQNMAISKNSVF